MTEGPREYDFDGLVGPSHNYAGLSRGNLASTENRGRVSNPRAAAKQGLEKMAHLYTLGVGQALLPPHPRPDTDTLRLCGFSGSDEDVVRKAQQEAPELLARVTSASAMWTANAATIAPSSDTLDGRVHVVPANLVAMFHRSIEAATTKRVLRAIFADERHFQVHAPLPAHPSLGDEGAANHTRLHSGNRTVHLFGWGRAEGETSVPTIHPARQSLLASQAVARLLQLQPGLATFFQQDARGIDQGAFHSDVLLVGNGDFLMLHELAARDVDDLLRGLGQALGSGFRAILATNQELPVRDAVANYPFNSQVVTLPDRTMRVIAPVESRDCDSTRRFLERVVNEDNPVTAVDYLDVRQSMSNGGGPACLRLRVVLTGQERAAIKTNVFVNHALLRSLEAWIDTHYRDRVSFDDLCDPAFLRDGKTALDELTELLGLGSVYEFQR